MIDLQTWFSELDANRSVSQLFEHIPDLMYFVKDSDLRIVTGNLEFAQHCGFSSSEKLHGCTDDEIFQPYMANKFRSDDLVVIESGTPLLNLVELFPTREGLPEWFITHKLPLHNSQGAVHGLCGIVQSYERILGRSNDPIFQFVGHIRDNYANTIAIPEIARKIGLSQRQLERRFQTVFRTSPRKYIVRLRVLVASDQLRDSDAPITEIAHKCGFYDHSSFIRHFRSIFGTTPLAYRKQYKK